MKTPPDVQTSLPRRDAIDDVPLDLANYLTFRLARVQAKLSAEGARVLRQISGLSQAQWRIILILGAYGETSPADLSRIADFDKGLLSRKIRLLVDQGLVTTRPHPMDRRVQITSLTPAGRTVYDETLPHMRARLDRLHDLLEPAELAAVFGALEKLEAAVSAGEAAHPAAP